MRVWEYVCVQLIPLFLPTDDCEALCVSVSECVCVCVCVCVTLKQIQKKQVVVRVWERVCVHLIPLCFIHR